MQPLAVYRFWIIRHEKTPTGLLSGVSKTIRWAYDPAGRAQNLSAGNSLLFVVGLWRAVGLEIISRTVQAEHAYRFFGKRAGKCENRVSCLGFCVPRMKKGRPLLICLENETSVWRKLPRWKLFRKVGFILTEHSIHHSFVNQNRFRCSWRCEDPFRTGTGFAARYCQTEACAWSPIFSGTSLRK